MHEIVIVDFAARTHDVLSEVKGQLSNLVTKLNHGYTIVRTDAVGTMIIYIIADIQLKLKEKEYVHLPPPNPGEITHKGG